ncbi:decorin isoform 1-T1 [Rhynchocyon petersi]
MRYIMKATIIFLLLAQASWAGPFQQRGLFDFMLEDEGSALDPDEEYLPFGCPFRCQCHLRVVQCSDLGLPTSLTELHLDGNKIIKVDAASLKGLYNLAKLGLSFNSISSVDNGSLPNVPHLRELHLNNNKLTRVPVELAAQKYLQIVYLHNNNISEIGADDFCVHGYNGRKASYTSLSLYGNPVQYWEILPSTFRCVYVPGAIQLGNFK